MSVRLQLENGEVREYPTWYPGDDDDSEAFYTDCGMTWNSQPYLDDGCNHIDCAIAAAERPSKDAVKLTQILSAVGMFWLVAGIVGLWISDTLRNVGFALFAIYVLGRTYFKSAYLEGTSKELKEFKEHGTVNKIKAEQIQ